MEQFSYLVLCPTSHSHRTGKQLWLASCLNYAEVGEDLAFRLVQVTVAEGQYELAAELLRFIVPPGDDNLLIGLPRPVQMNGQAEQQGTQQQGVVAAKPEKVLTSLASSSLNASAWHAQPQTQSVFCCQPCSAEGVANNTHRCVLSLFSWVLLSSVSDNACLCCWMLRLLLPLTLTVI